MIGCNDYFLNGPLYGIKFALKTNISVEITVLLECDYIDIKLESFMFCRNHAIHFTSSTNRWSTTPFDKRTGRILQ